MSHVETKGSPGADKAGAPAAPSPAGQGAGHEPPKRGGLGLLARLLIVLGILANVGLLVVNMKPDRPQLVRLRHAKVLLCADPLRAKWVKENELDPYGEEHRTEFEVEAAPSFEEVVTALEHDRASEDGFVLAVIDDAIADPLREARLVRPLDGVVPKEKL